MEPGDPWPRKIEEALEKSPVVLICLGSSGPGPFQDQIEIPVALKLANSQRARVIPVLLPGFKEGSRFPLFLTPFQSIDLRSDRRNGLRQLAQRILRSNTNGGAPPGPYPAVA